ncbi:MULTISPECIES: hypothetical protein [Amycolatopsis]|uniref:Uncharacterized protein n=2 Tax=Amycolatopsis TaxID=1813 RepID=A0A229S4E1_9PSEU|nr:MULTISPECIES: hypothetical protein [Amycolatopsis]AXB41294.1 hypothetical protein A4R43_01155 [Amycolatopsis albispora]OXM53766.1 hypothetical protein CFP71_21380 [Amycolatopsis thailandensis]
MKFVSEQNPGLVVRDLGVRFVDGEAEVDGKTAAELRKLPPELGVREAGKSDTDESAAGTGAKPRRARPE